MAVLHKEAVIFIDSHKCPETGFKFLAAMALATTFQLVVRIMMLQDSKTIYFKQC